jgi:predicted N-acyltransferase
MTEGVSTLPRGAWNRLVGDESPFLEWEWLASLEETGCVGGQTGWISRTLVGYEDDRQIGRASCRERVWLKV